MFGSQSSLAEYTNPDGGSYTWPDTVKKIYDPDTYELCAELEFTGSGTTEATENWPWDGALTMGFQTQGSEEYSYRIYNSKISFEFIDSPSGASPETLVQEAYDQDNNEPNDSLVQYALELMWDATLGVPSPFGLISSDGPSVEYYDDQEGFEVSYVGSNWNSSTMGGVTFHFGTTADCVSGEYKLKAIATGSVWRQDPGSTNYTTDVDKIGELEAIHEFNIDVNCS